jgi:thioredoxin reductase (NADPH)
METIGPDLRVMQRVPLAASHVAAIRAVGVPRHYPAGTVLVRAGEPADRFVYVEDGEI